MVREATATLQEFHVKSAAAEFFNERVEDPVTGAKHNLVELATQHVGVCHRQQFEVAGVFAASGEYVVAGASELHVESRHAGGGAEHQIVGARRAAGLKGGKKLSYLRFRGEASTNEVVDVEKVGSTCIHEGFSF